MTVVMKVLAVTGRGVLRDPTYLQSWDIDAHDGRGEAIYTDSLDAAYRFPDVGALFTAWKEQSTVRPLRDDGKPNRPLTALTIETVDLEGLASCDVCGGYDPHDHALDELFADPEDMEP